MTASNLLYMRGLRSPALHSAGPSQGKPPARYPTSLAGDAHLTIGVDRLQTRLTAPLNASGTQMNVQDGTGIIPNTLLTIDNEIVQTVSGAGNQWTITRGHDGTTPAGHQANAIVSGFINAWHHNALVAEVEAIETALGANLSNVGRGIVSSAYDFPAQSPSGALVVGANSITMSPVPAGVNGTDAGHYVYVETTGTPEAALIIGGSGAAGQPSGQIIIQCAFPHPAGWTIRSASGGIQEALVAAASGGGGTVHVSAGTTTVRGTVRIPAGACMHGEGASTILVPGSSGMTMFTFSPAAAPGFHRGHVSHLQIDASSFPGVNAVKGFYGSGVQQVSCDHIWLNNVRYGFYFTSGCWDIDVRAVFTLDNSGAFFGDDTGVSHSFSVLVDGWYNHFSAGIAAFPVFTLQRLINSTVSNFITQDLRFLATGVLINNDCQGVSVIDSTIVAPVVGIDIKWDPVSGQTGSGPNWNRIVNVMVDQAEDYGIRLAAGVSWSNFTGISIQGLRSGGTGIYNPASCIGNVYTALNVQSADNAIGFLADASSRGWSITDSYFLAGGAAATGVKVNVGAFEFRISDSLFEGTGIAIDDASGFVIKSVARNQNTTATPILQTDVYRPLAEDYNIVARSVSVKGGLAIPHLDIPLVNGANQNILIATGNSNTSFARLVGPSGPFSLGGFTNGADGKILQAFNTSGQAMTITNEDPGSTAVNRIATGAGANVVLAAGNSCASFIYDSVSLRWILTAHQP